MQISEYDLELANDLVRACENDLNRVLTIGERTDLLCDNTNWTIAKAKEIAGKVQ